MTPSVTDSMLDIVTVLGVSNGRETDLPGRRGLAGLARKDGGQQQGQR